jgi:hypothetical protein
MNTCCLRSRPLFGWRLVMAMVVRVDKPITWF